ncbi:MAG: RdgB/HAM1 family non-canonical purine NTP pyrophosphatase [Sphingobacteriaceae bacterium]
MIQLIFATNNRHKIEEVAEIVGSQFEVLSLNDIGFKAEIIENGKTFHENAAIKSHTIHQKYNLNCFGDDSGLEIEALNHAPGVYSARYAGEHGNHEANTDKVISLLQHESNRKARFRTVISLIFQHKEYFFEGEVTGTIRTTRSGTAGFGYDPIFQPDGYPVTFAEMSMEQKNSISHRAKAMEQLITFLKQADNLAKI